MIRAEASFGISEGSGALYLHCKDAEASWLNLWVGLLCSSGAGQYVHHWVWTPTGRKELSELTAAGTSQVGPKLGESPSACHVVKSDAAAEPNGLVC